MENRTLTIAEDIPGLQYEYEICTKTFLGICTHSEIHVDKYDLTDPKVKHDLKAAGFVMKVREKVAQ